MTRRWSSSSSSDAARTFVVQSHQDGMRLDAFLAAVVPRLTRTRAGSICRKAVTLVPPRSSKPGRRLHAGDRVVLSRLDQSPAVSPICEVLAIRSHLVALGKPAGLLVHPTARIWRATVTHQLESGQLGCGLIGAEPAHRLDRETSGVLLAGRDRHATRQLRGLFATGRVSKVYAAVAIDREGIWQPGDERLLDTPLSLASDIDDGALVGIRMVRGHLAATTFVRAIARDGDRVLLRCRLGTGRQHQIRAHLAMAGTPLLGDKLYALGDAFFDAWSRDPERADLCRQLPWPRQALHAVHLRTHTEDEGLAIAVWAPWTKDFPWNCWGDQAIEDWHSA